MERDRKQIMKLLYLLAPILMIWTTFCASFCYELGKNGLEALNLIWILKTNMPILIVASSMFYYGHKTYGIFTRK